MSSTIGVFLVEREPSRRSSWQANYTVSPEQNIFSEIQALKAYKELYDASIWTYKQGM